MARRRRKGSLLGLRDLLVPFAILSSVVFVIIVTERPRVDPTVHRDLRRTPPEIDPRDRKSVV